MNRSLMAEDVLCTKHLLGLGLEGAERNEPSLSSFAGKDSNQLTAYFD